MKNEFLHVSNVRRVIEAVTALRGQAAGLPCLAAWHGPAGRGKTETSIWYAGNHDALYMIPQVNSSQLDLLNDLYAALKGQKDAKFHRRRDAFGACLRLMWNRSAPVLIDEADRISKHTDLVETVRDLSDRTGCPVIFVGTDQMLVHLMQREQIASRLAEVVEFKPLSVDEVVMATAELCGLELNQDAAQVLHRRTQGFFRDLVVALSHIERTARANKLSDLPAEMVDKTSRLAIKRAA